MNSSAYNKTLLFYFTVSEADMGDLSHMTWLESDSSRKFEDLRLAWLTLIKDSTWLWLGLHDLRLDLDLRQMTRNDFFKVRLNVGYGICDTPADFKNTQLKWSYPLSFNADSDSTHSKYMDAQSRKSANTDAREWARLARLEFRVVF